MIASMLQPLYRPDALRQQPRRGRVVDVAPAHGIGNPADWRSGTPRSARLPGISMRAMAARASAASGRISAPPHRETAGRKRTGPVVDFRPASSATAAPDRSRRPSASSTSFPWRSAFPLPPYSGLRIRGDQVLDGAHSGNSAVMSPARLSVRSAREACGHARTVLERRPQRPRLGAPFRKNVRAASSLRSVSDAGATP